MEPAHPPLFYVAPRHLKIFLNLMNAELCNTIFDRSINEYHKTDSVDAPLQNPYDPASPEGLLYQKNWIDTVQWHLEDLIRDPEISPARLVELKRRIDRSNQDRTDLVEKIDDQFVQQFQGITPRPDARINSETPAWLVDRISILALKIYHMREQTERTEASPEHILNCKKKLAQLLEQREDLSLALTQLIEDIQSGVRFMKVYRQMKMYNDASLNPVLYSKKEN